MPLNWSITEVENWEELTKNKDEVPVTMKLVEVTNLIGIHRITAENYGHFYARVHLYEKLEGALIQYHQGPRYITKEDVRRRIGLTTNAGTLTRKQFTDKMMLRFYEFFDKV